MKKMTWQLFFDRIDEKATDSLLDLAFDTNSAETVSSVDELLRDDDFMYFYKDSLISQNLTKDFFYEDESVAEQLTDNFYSYIKKSNNEKIKSLFGSVNSDDKEFIDVLIRKLVFSLGVKKYYEYKYKIRI